MAASQHIAVVDFGAGNLRSVETVLGFVCRSGSGLAGPARREVRYSITSDPKRILDADRLIFPGVGEARAAMEVLRSTGLDEAVTEFYRSGKPLLGICIGCQVVLERSDERDARCLGLVKGSVRRFPDLPGLKVPHMGWNQVVQLEHAGKHPVLNRIPDGSSFYFVHSYYPEPLYPGATLCETEYGVRFASCIGQANLFAVQFHPEKSGENGLRLLSDFLEWDP